MESTLELTIVKGRTHTYTPFSLQCHLVLLPPESLTGGSLQDRKALDLESDTCSGASAQASAGFGQ